MSQEEIAISYSFARPWKNNHHGGSSFKLYFLLCSSSPLKGRHFNRHNWAAENLFQVSSLGEEASYPVSRPGEGSP